MNYLVKSVDASQAQMEASGDGRTISGYASVFGNVDSYNEIVVNGAFARTIKERYPKNLIKLFYGHYEPIGTLSKEPYEDATGLYVETRVADTPEARRAYQLVKDGVAAHMSIGYEVREDSTEKRGGDDIRLLKDVELWEVSAVVFPANTLATIQGVKCVGAPHIKDIVEAAGLVHRAALGVIGKPGDGYLSDAELAVIEAAKSQLNAVVSEIQLYTAIKSLRHSAVA